MSSQSPVVQPLLAVPVEGKNQRHSQEWLCYRPPLGFPSQRDVEGIENGEHVQHAGGDEKGGAEVGAHE